MTFTKKVNQIQYFYNIAGSPLNSLDSVTDLGIVFDSKLRFDKHVDLICRKSFKLLGFIFRRGKEFKDPSVLLLLFFCLVRTNLEYLSQIWNPFYGDYGDRIESIQRRFTKHLCFKFVPSTSHISYTIRCDKFNLMTLENRRVLLDEYFLFKIVNNLLDTSLLSSFNFYVPAYRTRHHQLFQPTLSRTNLGLSSIVNRLESAHMLYFNTLDLFNMTLLEFRNKCNVIMCSNSS